MHTVHSQATLKKTFRILIITKKVVLYNWRNPKVRFMPHLTCTHTHTHNQPVLIHHRYLGHQTCALSTQKENQSKTSDRSEFQTPTLRSHVVRLDICTALHRGGMAIDVKMFESMWERAGCISASLAVTDALLNRKHLHTKTGTQPKVFHRRKPFPAFDYMRHLEHINVAHRKHFTAWQHINSMTTVKYLYIFLYIS